MKILLLGPHKHLVEFLESFGDEVIQYLEPLSDKYGEGRETYHVIRPEAAELLREIDFIISYGYRFIICKEITDMFKGRAINLHISYLPYNRGADPNLWSVLEDTPSGVTIHCLDGHIDTGNIIAQNRLEFMDDDTLRTSYRRLAESIESLFEYWWPKIRSGEAKSLPQLTYHRVRDKERFQHLLEKGWDTPVKDLLGKAKGV